VSTAHVVYKNTRGIIDRSGTAARELIEEGNNRDTAKEY
jgi:hypothetical protein